MGKDKENEKVDAVQQYLQMQNRPLSINDLLQKASLKELGKAAVQKSLDQLVVDGKVKEKTYNKQKIYVIDQNLVTSANDGASIMKMDEEIAQLSREVGEYEEALKQLEKELKNVSSAMSVEEIEAELKILGEENKRLEAKYEELSQSKAKVSPTDFKKAKQIKEKSSTELRKRKRICLEMLDQILENYPKSKKALYEEIGIESV